VDEPPLHWSYCGICEAERTGEFIRSVRDPNLKQRLESLIR
jgi:hypothetical protein